MITEESTTAEGLDERDNNLVAAGAIYAALSSAGITVEVVLIDEGAASNQLDVRFPFLKSPYRITVERIRDETP